MNKNSLLKILMFSLPMVIIVLVVILVSRTQRQPITTTFQKPISTPTPTPEAFIPSKWAADEEVLNIESNLLKIDKDLMSIDLKKLQLLPPVLDMEVKF